MKTSKLIWLLPLLITVMARARTDDERAANQAILNYVEGFYEGDSTKIASGVFPDVNKPGFYIPKGAEAGEYVVSPMSFEQMFEYTSAVQQSGLMTEDTAPKEIEIYKVLWQTPSRE